MSWIPRRCFHWLSVSPLRPALVTALTTLALVAQGSEVSGVGAGQYILSGSPSGTGRFIVDDKLEVFLNGEPIYTDAVTVRDYRQPITFMADIGDQLRFVVTDTATPQGGYCPGLSTLYLVDPQGQSAVATPGFNIDCPDPPGGPEGGAPGPGLGLVFDVTYTIPDIPVAGSSYKEKALPGSAFAGPLLLNGSLYGVTYDGGNRGGTIYRASPDLSQLTTLYAFPGNGQGGQIGVPYGELTPGGKGFFGTTFMSVNNGGAIFEFDTSTNQITYLYDLSGFGNRLYTPLLLLDGYLYGGSGSVGSSRIFRVRSDGTSAGPEILHEFTGIDGWSPGGLTRGPDGYLYGTALQGGDLTCNAGQGCGTVFRLQTDGQNFSVLHIFNKTPFNGDQFADASPQRRLVRGSDDRLYGTTYRGVFSLAAAPAPADFRYIFSLNNLKGSQIFAPPAEGSDGRIYVAQYDGGIDLFGAVYSMTKSGGNVVMHHQFGRNGQAYLPYGQLTLDSSGTIYGTTEYSDVPLGQPSPGYLFAIRPGTGSSNLPPIANAIAPGSVTAGANCEASVQLNGTGSSDPDGGALTYHWTENGVQIATGPTPSVPLGIGTHTIRLTVTDPANATGFDDVTVTVANGTTVAYVGPNLLQSQGSNVLQANVTGPTGPVAGADITFTVNGTPFAATSNGAGVASVDVGAVAGSSAAITIDYPAAPCGGATQTVTKTVNRWPTVSPSAPSPVFAGALCTASVALAANATDPDGNSLTYLWSEGGVTRSTDAAPTLSLSPGLHTIDLSVSDGNGGSASGSATIDVRKALTGLNFVAPLPQFTVGVAVQVSAKLVDAANAPIQGASLAFSLTGASANSTTDASGVATVTIIPTTNGFQEISVSYDGDNCRGPVSFKTNVTVAQPPATIVVTTVVTNDNGGSLTAADFTYTMFAASPNPPTFAGSFPTGVTVTVNAGDYLVIQATRPEYITTLGAECAGTIAAGETKNCTITNNDRPTTLTLVKQVTNDNGGTLQPSAWTLLANNVPFTQGQVTPVTPGQYALSETGPGGYTASNWNCVPGTMNGSTVTIALGTEAVCTIANDDQPAALTLTKLVQNDNGGTRLASDWQLTAGALLFVSGVPQVVPAGAYPLGESGPGGYAPSAWSCTGSGSLVGSRLTLAPGQAASCSITNDDIPAGNASFTRLTPGTGRAGPITLTATLRDTATGQPLVGRTVLFTLGSQTTAAPTDFDGVAKAPLILEQAPGKLTLTAAFAGDTTYAATQATRPFEVVVDTDGDGLPDSWETNGLDLTGDGTIDLPLPAMGANPLRKDVFVEVDWMVKPDPCIWLVCWSNGGVLRPQRAVLDMVAARFAAAPVSNPDGSTGISLHVDGGPDTVMNPLTGELWGALSRAGVVPFDASLGAVTTDGQYDWSEFDAIKQAFLEPARRPVFHYAIYADTLAQDYYGGLSRDFLAADFVLAAGDSTWNGGMTATQEAGVFIHELGHNLGLRHGGGDNFNNKPNYFSSMNYLWALTGLPPDSRPDYSLGLEASINETVAGDANGDGRLTTLVDFADWANLVYTGGGIGGLDAEPDQLTTPIDPMDPVVLRAQGNFAADGDALLHFRGPTLLVLNSGVQSLTIDVTNISDVDTDYTVSAESALVPGGVSGGASVAAGGVVQVALPVDTTGLVPGEYAVTFILRGETGDEIHRQPATVVVVDLSIPENLAAAQAALDQLGALPPGSGLDPSVLDQINDMVQGALNAAPIANNQSVSTLVGTQRAITLTATDADADPLTYVVVSLPAHGSLTGTAPDLTYTPAPGYTGPDSFTFKANDGKADSNIATIDITVTAVNAAPIANNQSVSTLAGTPKAITLTATDADPDPLTHVVVSLPAHGSLTGTAPDLTYTPAPGYTGPDSFTFKANDGKADSNIATIDITVTPLLADVVVFLSDAPDPVTIGQPLTYAVRLRNDGPDPAVNPQVTISLPSGVSYTPAAPCTGTTVLTCAPGTLAFGEERSFDVTVTPMATGQIAATASVTDTDNNDSNDSASVTTTVTKAASTTVLESAPASSTFGGSVTLTATVTGYGTPAGTVTFLVDRASLGSSSLTNGVATLTTSSLATGTRSLTATYSGDSFNETGSSAPVAHVVQPVASTTTLSSSLNPSLAGQQVTFTATVTGATPTGTVTFTIDNVSQSAVALVNGSAALQTSSLIAGTTHSVVASYSGDGNNAPSVSQPLSQVVQRVSTSIVLSTSPNPSMEAQLVTISATVTGAAPTGTVTFSIDGSAQTPVAVSGAGIATLTSASLPAGTRTIAASYSGDVNNEPGSATPVAHLVKKTSTTVLRTSLNPSAAGQLVTFTAAVTGLSPTGSVEFIIDGVSSTVPLAAGGTATFAASALTAGAHVVTAGYLGDTNNTPSASAQLTQQVGKAATTVTLIAQPNPAAPGTTVDLIATVTGSSPTGAVTFLEGNQVLGIADINPTTRTATLQIAQGKKGSRQLSASYPGDVNNLASTSPRVRLTTK